ncbi:hypothetical protein BGZ63DRAFT_408493 [Mariannaea sp. PMI_226]|nr:hypothetical protein BGZ63DRAFT_408493 [Mariannaea sp. PMI_226]
MNIQSPNGPLEVSHYFKNGIRLLHEKATCTLAPTTAGLYVMGLLICYVALIIWYLRHPNSRKRLRLVEDDAGMEIELRAAELDLECHRPRLHFLHLIKEEKQDVDEEKGLLS